MQSSLPAGSETGPVLPELSFSFCGLLLFLLAQRQPSPVTVHYCAPVPVTWFSTLHTLPHLIHPCQCYKDALIFWIWQIKKKNQRKGKATWPRSRVQQVAESAVFRIKTKALKLWLNYQYPISSKIMVFNPICSCRSANFSFGCFQFVWTYLYSIWYFCWPKLNLSKWQPAQKAWGATLNSPYFILFWLTLLLPRLVRGHSTSILQSWVYSSCQ